MKKWATGTVATVFFLFILAPGRFIEFLLVALKFHPWLLCAGIATILGLYVWLLRVHYLHDGAEGASANPNVDRG